MIIRRLTPTDDLTATIEILRRFFREEGFTTSEQAIAENTKRMVSLDMCGIFLAEHDGVAVGVATLSIDFGVEFGWSAEMGDLYVVPAWRGKGVSREIVAAVEAFARKKGAAGYAVTLTPHALHDQGLLGFYTRLGFANEGRVILWRGLT